MFHPKLLDFDTVSVGGKKIKKAGGDYSYEITTYSIPNSKMRMLVLAFGKEIYYVRQISTSICLYFPKTRRYFSFATVILLEFRRYILQIFITYMNSFVGIFFSRYSEYTVS